MKTQNKTKWLIPFVECVKDIVPVKKITHLKGYKVSSKREALQYGSCSLDNKGNYIINMRLYRWDEKSKEHIPLYIGHLLETFAHELAHTVEWCHTPRHMKITGKILSRFEKVLKKQNIKDTYRSRMKYD